uniref:RNA-directed RNA polymerase n=1 Tax=Beihai levi-like virus 4 TaxID=1922422 RepID=A0A1L3KI58_9VIRU|nr:hypothetical protein [Beihai levi-like virus 4]
MKSTGSILSAIYKGVVDDAALVWPNLRRSLERDLSRLLRAYEDRGIHFLTVILPEAGKILDRELDGNEVDWSEAPRGYPLLHREPRLFRGLRNLIFDEGKLRPDADPNAVLFLRQLHFMLKKWKGECPATVRKESINDFIRTDASLPTPSSAWDEVVPSWNSSRGDHPFRDDRSPLYTDQRLELSGFAEWCTRIVHSCFPDIEWLNLRPKHGPGAVAESRLEKYSFPNWTERLDRMFPFDWYVDGLRSNQYPDYRETFSVFHAVPKTQKSPRIICAEPISHQYAQQALWDWLRKAVNRSFLSKSIDFTDQERSQELATLGSLNQSYCTIDLSSASDRLSCRLIEWIFFEHPLLDYFQASRTRYCKIHDAEAGFNEIIKLRKFSTQGSALTFPVQTIVYTIIAGYVLARGYDWKKMSDSQLRDHIFSQVRVFGDDIIVPNSEYDHTVQVLEELGFVVNTAKSHNGVAFRESCGMDAFKGYPVTPCYVPQTYDGIPGTLASTVDTAVNLYMYGFYHASEAVWESIPSSERKLIPTLNLTKIEDGSQRASGLFMVCRTDDDLSSRKKFWDDDLHYDTIDTLTVESTTSKDIDSPESGLTQWFIENPRPDEFWSHGIVQSVRLRKRRTRVVL